MKYDVRIGAAAHEVAVGPDGVTVDGSTVAVDLEGRRESRPGHGAVSALVDGQSLPVTYTRNPDTGTWSLTVRGTTHDVDVLDERQAQIRAMARAAQARQGPRPVKAPMPGLVSAIEVSVGDAVRAGQGVVIVEAMKMENELRAEADAVVSRIAVEVGAAVDKDQVLVEFETPAADGDTETA